MPKFLKLVVPSSFNVEDPPNGTNTIQYAPAGVDLLRYRLNKLENIGPPKNVDRKTAYGALVTYESVVADRFVTDGGIQKLKEIATLTPSNQVGLFDDAEQANKPFSADNNWGSSISRGLQGAADTNPTIKSLFPTMASNTFFDYTTKIDIPYTKKEWEKINSNSPELFIDVHSQYNFYQGSYESIASTGSLLSIPETLLPSFYSFASILDEGETMGETISGQRFSGRAAQNQDEYIWEKHISLDGEIENVYTELMHQQTSRTEPLQYVRKQTKNYFDQYATAIVELSQDSQKEALLDELSNYYKHQILPPADLERPNLFTGVDSRASRFPISCRINFNLKTQNLSSPNTEQQYHGNVSALESLMDALMRVHPYQNAGANPPRGGARQLANKFYIFTILDIISNSNSLATKLDFNVGMLPPGNSIPFTPDNLNTNISEIEKLDSYDFKGWLEFLVECLTTQRWDTLRARLASISGNNNFVAYTRLWAVSSWGDTIMDNQIWSMAEIVGLTHLALQLLNGVPNQSTGLAKKKDILARTYKTLVDEPNEDARFETLFYKIEKWAVGANNTPVGTEPIQNFWLPHSNESVTYDFVDTQVKYGKKYIYRFYSYDLIYGTQYQYVLDDLSPSPNTTISDKQAEVCVLSVPSCKLVGVPYFQKLVQIADAPPVAPDVDILQYQGIKNKVLFLLKGNVGNYKQQPIIIKDQDKVIFQRIRTAFDLNSNEKINFKGDDPSTDFEIFRLDKKPTSYKDFAKGFYKQFDAGEFKTPCKTAGGASFVDDITPNKKYYYTFRAIDIHGNISNPSPIYQIEISYDGATPILLTEVIEFGLKKIPEQMPAKKVKKYLRIKPAFSQTLLNQKSSGLLENDGKYKSGEIENHLASPANWIHLGTDDQGLWGKTFKIRVVSRKSGKKLDLNIKFESKTVISEINTDNKVC